MPSVYSCTKSLLPDTRACRYNAFLPNNEFLSQCWAALYPAQGGGTNNTAKNVPAPPQSNPDLNIDAEWVLENAELAPAYPLTI